MDIYTGVFNNPVTESVQRAISKNPSNVAFATSCMIPRFAIRAPSIVPTKRLSTRRLVLKCSSSMASNGQSARVEKAAVVLREAESAYRRAKKAYKAAEAAYKAEVAVQSSESSKNKHGPDAAESELQELEAAYLVAKAARKAEKRNVDPVNGALWSDGIALEEDYRVKKAAYKAKKAALKSRKTISVSFPNAGESLVVNDSDKRTKQDSVRKPEVGFGQLKFSNMNFERRKRDKEDKEMSRIMSNNGSTKENRSQKILVCGGKSCSRLGAAVVAELLLGPRIVPNSKCMNACGGVGPSVFLDGQLLKVDIRGTAASAIASAKQNDESPSLKSPNLSI